MPFQAVASSNVVYKTQSRRVGPAFEVGVLGSPSQVRSGCKDTDTRVHQADQEILGKEGFMGRTARCLCMTALLGSSLFWISCGVLTESRAETAQEFVEKYSQAYRTGNVSAIVKMTELAADQTEESFRQEVEKDLDSHGFGYVAWTHTRYVSEADRGDHIRVEVEVQYARSSIVLVRRDGVLRVVQDPSRYE